MQILLLMIAFSCALVRSSPTDLRPAEIFASATEVLEGDILKELKCIFDRTSKGEVHMYLCKDGVGIRMEILTAKRESIFKLSDVKKEDSGNYTCVYSKDKQTSNTVTVVGKNSIFIQVKDLMMAHIFIRNPNVSEGDNVDVKCNIIKAKTQKTLHMYLCKNGIGVNMERVQAEEANFTLKQVKKEDSGNYSCVYSIKKHLPNNVTATNFKNSVIIQVTGQGKSSQNTPSQTWIIWVTIPVILLCFLGALSCFYRRRLLAKRRTEATQEPEAIYSEARFLQSNREAEPCNGAIRETLQTVVIYSETTRSRSKRKPKSSRKEEKTWTLST